MCKSLVKVSLLIIFNIVIILLQILQSNTIHISIISFPINKESGQNTISEYQILIASLDLYVMKKHFDYRLYLKKKHFDYGLYVLAENFYDQDKNNF